MYRTLFYSSIFILETPFPAIMPLCYWTDWLSECRRVKYTACLLLTGESPKDSFGYKLHFVFKGVPKESFASAKSRWVGERESVLEVRLKGDKVWERWDATSKRTKDRWEKNDQHELTSKLKLIFIHPLTPHSPYLPPNNPLLFIHSHPFPFLLYKNNGRTCIQCQ